MNKIEFDQVQTVIGHSFSQESLLLQAFTRKSYSQEHPGVENNEVLEFYGDEVLDFFITKSMYKQFSKMENGNLISVKTEGELTKLKSAYVNKATLALCINNLGLHKFLRMGNSDIKNEAQNSSSVKEDLFEAILGAVAIDCNWDFAELEKVCETMLQTKTSNPYIHIMAMQKAAELGFGTPEFHPLGYQAESVEDMRKDNWFELYFGIESFNYAKNHKTNLFEYGIQIGEHKFLGTSPHAPFQAKLNADEKAYLFLCSYEIKQKLQNLDYSNPVSQLHELFQKKVIAFEPYYEFSEYHDDNGNPIWRCYSSLEGIAETFSAEGISKKEVKQSAALKLLKFLSEIQVDEIEEWPRIVFYSGSLRDPKEREKWGIKE